MKERQPAVLDRLEHALARLVEGSVSGAFRLRVQPADIGRHLERSMLDGRMTSVGAILAPNHYEVRLHPEDVATFAGWEDALCREMEAWLADVAFARGLATVGSIQVYVVGDASVARRSVQTSASFVDVISRSPQPRETRHAALRLVSLDASEPSVTLVDRALRVGRAESNDLVLSSAEVSRHHARLELDTAGHVWHVVDLNSTNGTWVNGRRVARVSIASGDVIAFASSGFRAQSHARPDS